jgi:hypothetical protein
MMPIRNKITSGRFESMLAAYEVIDAFQETLEQLECCIHHIEQLSLFVVAPALHLPH